ncbi:minor capsid protein (plasmid) [Apilactobacillus apisilvae]|uniref:Minor capsid protein n=1 Tax=Apilactobacillus apisilvae TaxID=2923364 RepID=A0ABY4PJ04_9LACO|nr:minor capsid protein [Apilactobacillus apisilvae]UQS85856.1 minor capsid protein [Apilactobacillus apisilvae]
MNHSNQIGNQNYWKTRALQTKVRAILMSNEYELALSKRMNGLKDDLQQRLKQFYTMYADNEGIPYDEANKILMNISSKHWEMTLDEFKKKAIAGGYTKELNSEYFKSRIARLEDLEKQLIDLSTSFAGQEQFKFEKSLVDAFDNTYMRTNYNIQQGFNYFTTDFAHFDEEQLKVIVSKPWKPSNFSSRIWPERPKQETKPKSYDQRLMENYRNELPSQLMDSLLRSTVIGASYQEVTKEFSNRFEDVSKKSIHRLVITEMAHVANESSFMSYEDNGVEEYDYLATLENRTCSVCALLDEKNFKVSERVEGKNCPVMHPHCRCTTVAHVSEMPPIKRWSKNGNEREYVDDMNFTEWKNKIA